MHSQSVTSVQPTTSVAAVSPAGDRPSAPVEQPRYTPPPVAAQSANQRQSQRPRSEIITAVAEQLQTYVQKSGRELEFRVDNSTGHTVVSVRDGSGTLIRQIPSEEALRLAERMSEGSGTLLDESA